MRSAVVESARESIIRAAFRTFGEGGIESTSLREVARAAGVSPALIAREFGDAYRNEELGNGADLLRERASQTARVMAELPEVCAYLGRALVERTAGASALFRLMVEAGQVEIDSLAYAGALRSDADRQWATLQHFFLIWAPLSFMPLLKEVLGDELLSPSQLDRWTDANVKLLEKGLYS
jgi:AcrR family transcriptional regulator